MKKAIIALMFALVLGQTSTAYAGSSISTAPFPVNAVVDSVLTLGIAVHEENPDGTIGNRVTSMPFIMVRDGNNALRGDKAYHVFLGTNTSGRAYFVNSTAPELTSGANTLPRSWGVFPIQATDGGDPPGDIVGDTLAESRSAVGTNVRLYDSNPAGQGAVIELVYGISGGVPVGDPPPFPGWQPTGPGQAAGNYVSTLTYTLTTLV